MCYDCAGLSLREPSECFQRSRAEPAGSGHSSHQSAAQVAGVGWYMRHDGIRTLRHLQVSGESKLSEIGATRLHLFINRLIATSNTHINYDICFWTSAQWLKRVHLFIPSVLNALKESFKNYVRDPYLGYFWNGGWREASMVITVAN